MLYSNTVITVIVNYDMQMLFCKSSTRNKNNIIIIINKEAFATFYIYMKWNL